MYKSLIAIAIVASLIISAAAIDAGTLAQQSISPAFGGSK